MCVVGWWAKQAQLSLLPPILFLLGLLLILKMEAVCFCKISGCLWTTQNNNAEHFFVVTIMRTQIWLVQHLSPWLYLHVMKFIFGCTVVRGPGFDSRRFQVFREVAGLERDPLSLMRTTEGLLGRNRSGSGQETNDWGGSFALTMQHPLSAKVGTTSPRSGSHYSSFADQSHGVFYFCGGNYCQVVT
jgi:hypothetical protein